MNQLLNRWSELLTERASVKVRLFTTGLYVFLLFKILFLLPIATDITLFYHYRTASIVKQLMVAPATAFNHYPVAFLIVSSALVVVLIFVKRTYLTNLLGFWIAVNVLQVSEPVTNGSDYVLTLMLLLSIPLTGKPLLPKWEHVQQPIYNATVLLIQVHVAFIYLVSGFDKLLTSSWRSGEVMHYITELDYFAHPLLTGLNSDVLFRSVAWFTIVFELAFPLLIWFTSFRMPLLMMGVLFHIGIIYFLNLPDFGLMMILCYAIFVNIPTTKS